MIQGIHTNIWLVSALPLGQFRKFHVGSPRPIESFYQYRQKYPLLYWYTYFWWCHKSNIWFYWSRIFTKIQLALLLFMSVSLMPILSIPVALPWTFIKNFRLLSHSNTIIRSLLSFETASPSISWTHLTSIRSYTLVPLVFCSLA